MTHLTLLCALFAVGYLTNAFYVTVLYHRGLAHGSVLLAPWTRKWVIATGNWVTGIDPKAWACMHRLHHRHSDTKRDPHSPWHQGVLGVMLGQLRSYERALAGLARGNQDYLDVVRDLDFPVHWLNRHKIWWLPYLLHVAAAAGIAAETGSALAGVAYWLGIMSHPIQGWLVNSFAHRFGYRNHATQDQSRNNTLVAWLVMGEGYQNNHHESPLSPKFSERWFELDWGYGLCVIASMAGIVTIPTVPVLPWRSVARIN